jgi:predicted lactoylglutathione lyase
MFVEMAVADLAAAKHFYRRLGFEFDSRLSDECMACLVVEDGSFAMLLVEEPGIHHEVSVEPDRIGPR